MVLARCEHLESRTWVLGEMVVGVWATGVRGAVGVAGAAGAVAAGVEGPVVAHIQVAKGVLRERLGAPRL